MTDLEFALRAIMIIGVAGLSIPIFDALKNIEIPSIRSWPVWCKRTAAIGLAAIIVGLVWYVTIWMGYTPIPGATTQKWVEALWAVILPTALLQQLLQALFPESFKPTNTA